MMSTTRLTVALSAWQQQATTKAAATLLVSSLVKATRSLVKKRWALLIGLILKDKQIYLAMTVLNNNC